MINAYDNFCNIWVNKKNIIILKNYFPPYGHSKSKIRLELLDLCNYATKSDLKTQQVSIHSNLLKR